MIGATDPLPIAHHITSTSSHALKHPSDTPLESIGCTTSHLSI